MYGDRPETTTLTVWSQVASVRVVPAGHHPPEPLVGGHLPGHGAGGAPPAAGRGLRRRGDARPDQHLGGGRIAAGHTESEDPRTRGVVDGGPGRLRAEPAECGGRHHGALQDGATGDRRGGEPAGRHAAEGPAVARAPRSSPVNSHRRIGRPPPPGGSSRADGPAPTPAEGTPPPPRSAVADVPGPPAAGRTRRRPSCPCCSAAGTPSWGVGDGPSRGEPSRRSHGCAPGGGSTFCGRSTTVSHGSSGARSRADPAREW